MRSHFILFSNKDDDRDTQQKKDIFKFHINQINHRFLNFVRGLIFQYYMPSINLEKVDAVLTRAYFNNPFWKTLTYWMYQKSID